MRRRITATIAIGALLSSRLAAQSITSIKLERTACYGTCPMYTISISSNGDVKYVGEDYVNTKGTRTSRISLQSFAELRSKAERIGFFQLEDSYDDIKIGDSFTTSTDLPTTIVTVTREGKSKRVRDYMGAPKGLYEFEQMIERVTNSQRWTGQKNELEDAPYYDHFPLNRKTKFRGVLRANWSGPLKNLQISGYELELPNNVLSFTIRAQKGIDLAKFSGDLVDATGVLDTNHDFHLTSIKSVRHVFDDKKPWP